jgi:hypothetical protein
VAAIRETAEVIAGMESRLSWFERTYGSFDNFAGTTVEAGSDD